MQSNSVLVYKLENENEILKKELLEERFLREDKERDFDRLNKMNTETDLSEKHGHPQFQKSIDSQLDSKDNDGWVKVSHIFLMFRLINHCQRISMF